MPWDSSQARPAAEYDQSDIRRVDPRFQPGNFEKNLAAARELTGMAAARGATVAQLALAWLLAQGDDVAPIPGTRDPGRVEENVGAADLILDEPDLERIAELLPNGGFGARYGTERMPVWV